MRFGIRQRARSRPLFLAPPVEYAANPPASVERFLLLRVQVVIKRLKLGLDCLQAGAIFSANAIRPGASTLAILDETHVVDTFNFQEEG